MERNQATERKLRFRAKLSKLDQRDLLYLRAIMLYKRLASPSARSWVEAFVVAFVLAHQKGGGMMNIHRYYLATVTMIAILVIACAGSANTSQPQPTLRAIPQPTVAEMPFPTSTITVAPSPTKTLTPTMTLTATALLRTPSPAATNPLPTLTLIPVRTQTWTPLPILRPSPTWTRVLVTAPTARPTIRICCKVCTTGKACGDTCISRDKTCRQPPGCACD